MRYVSTRGQVPEISFEDAVVAGLAADGGLYMPTEWPTLPPGAIAAMAGQPYAVTAAKVLGLFSGSEVDYNALNRLVDGSYSSFHHAAISPLVQIADDEWVLELFHGPTLAFKDFALQFLGRLLDSILAQRGETVTVIGATSGDTGSAAIEGLVNCQHAQVFILHPKGRVSDVQRRQMTTVDAPHIHNLAVEGTFDDCQAMVKALFVDPDFSKQHKLAAVNSINWARIAAQVVYYFTAAVSLGSPSRAPAFCVPTGNFGDVFAGYVAAKMGLPISRLIVATNRNDILTRFMETGRYSAADVVPTIAPSMDIQVSSNFERLLFDVYDRDGNKISQLMDGFKQTGAFEVEPARLHTIRRHFAAERVQEDEILQTICSVHQDTGMLLDPHTAIAVAAGRRAHNIQEAPLVHLATAHPAKFPDAVEKASGVRPSLPEHMADLMERDERMTTVPNTLDAIKGYINEHR